MPSKPRTRRPATSPALTLVKPSVAQGAPVVSLSSYDNSVVLSCVDRGALEAISQRFAGFTFLRRTVAAAGYNSWVLGGVALPELILAALQVTEDGVVNVSDNIVACANWVAGIEEKLTAGDITPEVSDGRIALRVTVQDDLEQLEKAIAASGTDLDGDVLATQADALVSARTGWATSGYMIHRTHREPVAAWARRAAARLQTSRRLALRIDPPSLENIDWTLTPLLLDVDDPTNIFVLDAATRGTLTPALEELVCVETTTAGEICPWVAQQAVNIGSEQAIDILVATSRFAEAGIELFAPKSLTGTTKVRSSLSVSGTAGHLSDPSLRVDVAFTLDVDGEPVAVSFDQLAAWAKAKVNVVEFAGSWLRLDAVDLEKAARLVKKAGAALSARDLLLFSAVDVNVDVGKVRGWVGQVRAGNWDCPNPSDPGAGFTAVLRDYQRAGLGWLQWLETVGIGGVLADDMGLGKTCQVLALIDADRRQGCTTLVVCPTTLLLNWVREAARFAPSLKVATFHGPDRGDLAALAGSHDVIVTSYGVLRRDETLRIQQWHRVVLDEAQQIKNPRTSTARAARALQASRRLALSGTPVENHLTDLWSLMEFTNPGLLGPLAAFEKTFANPLDASSSGNAAEHLATLISPVVLRRTKRDPGILDELPERLDLREPCALTAEQLGLYQSISDQLVEEANSLSGTKRRTTVLAALSRLKMVCAHPALLADSNRLGNRSGKLARLEELLSEIVEAGDAVVVFSQFASLLPALAEHLKSTLNCDVLHFTGRTSPAKRQKVVDAFSNPDGPPVLLVSLKAGGTGLNLVRANHVVHFDQWWNPAVEDQASDRAWRMGQTRQVEVHHLVCPGTLEERIEDLMADKRALAALVGGAGSLADMDAAGLKAFVSITSAAIPTDD